MKIFTITEAKDIVQSSSSNSQSRGQIKNVKVKVKKSSGSVRKKEKNFLK